MRLHALGHSRRGLEGLIRLCNSKIHYYSPMAFTRIFLLSALIVGSYCSTHSGSGSSDNSIPAAGGSDQTIENIQNTILLDSATLAGGCFWCVEAAFEMIEGVDRVISGYSGGKKEDAKYKFVAGGVTEHAESVRIYFDPDKISFEILLDIFFVAHNPTELNRQGPDIGKQYRSAIFFHDSNQRKISKIKIEEHQKKFEKKIVTQVVRVYGFYPAEAYHQDFERRNPDHNYILAVSRPKIDKVREAFKERLKPSQ